MHALRRPTALLMLAWYLAACTSYRTVNLAPQDAVAGQETVRITLSGGPETETLLLKNPWVRNDSIGGGIKACTPPAHRSQPWPCDYAPWASHLNGVSSIETRRPDVTKTSVLAVAIVGGLLVVYAADMSSGSGPY